MKMVGFTKVYNELEQGNLRRCLDDLTNICGKGNIVVCDDSSTDGSLDVIKEYTDHYIILPNEFVNELEHKQKLLELALSLNPDWIVWIDPDEIIEERGFSGIEKLCKFGDEFGIDCFNFHTINLWGSRCWYRTDSLFNQKHDIRLWKNNGNLRFPKRIGLHTPQHPDGLTKVHNTNLQVIHYGFSDISQIARKYTTYKKLGQSGFALERLRPDKDDIQLLPINLEWFPDEIKPKIEPPPRITKEEFEKACQKFL